MRGGKGTCVVNPAAGRELELPAPEPADVARRIAVVGGGPAGLEAARVAALPRPPSTLYEARDRLGGDLRLAGEAPHRSEILAAADWWERELALLGVEVRCGTRVESAAGLDAEEVVWAIGAEPAPTLVWRLRPHLVGGIPGSDGLPPRTRGAPRRARRLGRRARRRRRGRLASRLARRGAPPASPR